MNHGHSFHDEEVLGKAIDLPLVKRLIKYVRPYRLLVAGSVILILLLTGVTLALPMVYRTGVDNYIVTTYKSIDVSKAAPETLRLLEQLGDKLLLTTANQRLVSNKDFKELDPALSIRLTHDKLIGKPYLVVRIEEYPEPTRPEVTELILSRPALFKQGNGFYYALYEDAYEKSMLTREESRLLRAADLRGINILVLIFLGLLGMSFILTMLERHLSQYIGQRIIMDIRTGLFNHLERLSLKFFDSNPVGRLVTRVTNDIEVLSEAFTNIMINLFRDIFLLVGIVAMLLWLNWELALVTFCILPALVWVTFYFRRKVREAFREVRVKIASINATIAEHISGMSVVQLFHREKTSYDHFQKINHETYLANRRQITIFAIFRPVISTFQTLAIALLVWYGGGEVIQGKLNLGDLVAFFFYVRMFFQPINELSQKYNQLQQAMASSERVFQLLDKETRIHDPIEPLPLPEIRGEIEFRNVSFAYKDEDVLRNVSFKVKPGEKVALVGPTGAGKSSIISLLSRFYDVRDGQILVDGVDVRSIKKNDLRYQIAVVMQDVFIFSGDIKSNIRLNDASITDDAINSAARYARADSFINRLPGDFDHELHERGATLSQGQRQLLSFARAVAFNPKIFVLDEATANIDTETEVLIQQAIDNLMKNRTSIVIAHRLSTVRNVDRILVLNHGEIIEEGSHQELLARRGLYYKLYQLQYKDQVQKN